MALLTTYYPQFLPEGYDYSSALFYETGVDNPSTSSGQFSNSLG